MSLAILIMVMLICTSLAKSLDIQANDHTFCHVDIKQLHQPIYHRGSNNCSNSSPSGYNTTHAWFTVNGQKYIVLSKNLDNCVQRKQVLLLVPDTGIFTVPDCGTDQNGNKVDCPSTIPALH